MLVNSVYNNVLPQNINKIQGVRVNTTSTKPTFKGNIDLVSQQNQFNIAKNMCRKALNGDAPFEKVCVLDLNKNKIVSSSNGNRIGASVDIPFSLFSTNKYSVIHGHPTMIDKNNKKYSLPISLTDFEFLNKNKSVAEIISVDSQGKEYKIKKSDKFKKLSDTEFNELRKTYFSTLYSNLCDKEEKEHIDKLYDYVKKNLNSKTIKQNIVDKLLSKQYCSNAVKVIEDFWKDISRNLNVEFLYN